MHGFPSTAPRDLLPRLLQLNQEGCAAALLCEGLLAVKDAQLQLMWQVQRAQDINDAFLDAMRGHQHQLEAQVGACR